MDRSNSIKQVSRLGSDSLCDHLTVMAKLPTPCGAAVVALNSIPRGSCRHSLLLAEYQLKSQASPTTGNFKLAHQGWHKSVRLQGSLAESGASSSCESTET